MKLPLLTERGARRRSRGGPSPGGRPRPRPFGGSLRNLAVELFNNGLVFIFDPRPRNQRNRLPPGALSQALPVPVPTIPQLPGTPPPPVESFPRGPAANDPVFRRPPPIGRLLGLGGLIIDVALILSSEVARRQINSMGDILRKQDRDIARRTAERELERAEREAELRAEKAASALENAPETFDPTPVPPQVSPAPQTFPSVNPVVFPEIFPTAAPIPGPVAPTLPSTLPDTLPQTFPSPVNVPIRLPQFLPAFLPLTPFSPVGVPSPAPGGQPIGFLDASVQDFPTPRTAPQTDPAKCRPRRCDDDLDEPRTECFKGLYREGITETDFTQWVEIDCLTGKEL